MQYFVVAIIVFLVIIWQAKSYRQINNKNLRLKSLFPQDLGGCLVDKENGETSILYNDSYGDDFKETIDDINAYLSKNKEKTFDYQIIKEIVERNAQSLEDEVDTMLSAPLYLGLMATIFGIAFGVVAFAWNDLANLLSGANIDPEGIKVLLTDVGIAMIASFVGVYCTKQATSKFNEAKTLMSKNKNRFLTWIQTELLSKLSDDITGAIIRMTNDLNEFNNTFASNTQELKTTLSTVNSNYTGQIQLFEAIERLKINEIAKANIDVYNRLQGCSDELGNLLQVFENSEAYLNKVVLLNNNIGSIDERTKLFEELGNYFHNEMENVRERQGMMRQEMSGLDSVLQDALSNLSTSLQTGIQGLSSTLQTQNQKIKELIQEQQDGLSTSLREMQNSLNSKMDEIGNPFAGVAEVINQSIISIRTAFEEQNNTIKQMLDLQKNAMESSLETQQRAILAKFSETPGQFKALQDVAEVLKKLNAKIDHIGNIKNSDSDDETEASSQDNSSKYMKYLLPISMTGTFVALLLLIIIELFGIKL